MYAYHLHKYNGIRTIDYMSFFSSKKNTPTLPEIYADLHKNKDVLLLDVRTAKEYAQEHVLGAQTLPLSSITNETADHLKKYKRVYVICQTGGRSSVATRLLASVGIHAINTPGGIESWKAHKLPLA